MIDSVRDELIASGLAEPETALACNVYFGRSSLVNVFGDGALLFTAKVSPPGQIQAEYHATVEAHALFGALVPEPLAIREGIPADVAIWRGVPHAPLDPRWPARQISAVVAGFEAYFRIGSERLRVEAASRPHSARLAHVLAGLRRSRPDLQALPDHVVLNAAALDTMPHVRQHGDFWGGNVGIARSGLVVFDWEDFGSVTLHGHDLGVFVASILAFDGVALNDLETKGEPRYLDRLIVDFCRANGIDRTAFFDLLPAFLVEFLGLKLERGYASRIVDSVTGLLIDFGARAAN